MTQPTIKLFPIQLTCTWGREQRRRKDPVPGEMVAEVTVAVTVVMTEMMRVMAGGSGISIWQA